MTGQRAASVMKGIQRALLVLLVLWVAIHTVLVWRTGWSSWRLGGLGMYARPGPVYSAAVVVVCPTTGCDRELRMVDGFARAVAGERTVPVLTPADSTTGYAEIRIARSARPESGAARRFLTFPTARHADGLARSRLTELCGPYLVVHYHQHVSLVTRRATVDARPFELSYPGTRCDSRP